MLIFGHAPVLLGMKKFPHLKEVIKNNLFRPPTILVTVAGLSLLLLFFVTLEGLSCKAVAVTVEGLAVTQARISLKLLLVFTVAEVS